jgi:hypothetical protein
MCRCRYKFLILTYSHKNQFEMPKEITPKSLGKHIGHACEGHLRGLLKRITAETDDRVLRALPFNFHVNPDAVVCDANGAVRLVMVIAYWNDRKSSEKKFYRTRSEYFGARQARCELPEKFAEQANVITVIYGADGGWKEKVLADLKFQCAPCLYLPDLIGVAKCEEMVSEIFQLYRSHWEKGSSKSREYVEEQIANKPKLTSTETKLVEILEGLLSGEGIPASTTLSNVSSPSTVIVPTNSFRTRYRQGLGILSVFPDEEISVWLNRSNNKLSSDSIKAFAFRAAFLDVAKIIKKRSIGKVWFELEPKEPKRQRGNQWDYAPDLLDFVNWEEIPYEILKSILNPHRDWTKKPGSVFAGGAFDQVSGNWAGFCRILSAELPKILKGIQKKDINEISKLLIDGVPLSPEIWHPANVSATCYPLWAFSACAIAIAQNNRAIRSDYNARRQAKPTKVDAEKLATALIGNTESFLLLKELLSFSSMLLDGDLGNIAITEQPKLLSLSEPCSWVSDLYNTLTTNSSHNPLCGPILRWLKLRFPSHQWQGWPAKRSVSVTTVLGSDIGRRQWQFIGTSNSDPKVIAIEVKSITGNNWGNKSKELYDRVAETRMACSSIGLSLLCIGVLDGDFGDEQFNELRTGIGYDEIYSITEVLDNC